MAEHASPKESAKPAATPSMGNAETAMSAQAQVPTLRYLSGGASTPPPLKPSEVMYLQRAMGNRAVQQLLPRQQPPQSPFIPRMRVSDAQGMMKSGPLSNKLEQQASPTFNKSRNVAQPTQLDSKAVQRTADLNVNNATRSQMPHKHVWRVSASGVGIAPTRRPLIQRDPDDLFGDTVEAEETGKVQGIRDLSVARLALTNPTWDPNAIVVVDGKEQKGGWVEATPERNAKGTRSEIGTTSDSKRVDKRMVAGATLDPTKVNDKLLSGRLTESELSEITPQQVAHVNPLSEQPRNILKNTLHESWHHAKHVLLAGGGNKVAREMLMAKLWEFRQWHYDLILRRTQADPTIGKEGLEEWKAAGSTTLTSDIDVNLKGNKTELAVGVFNRLFKADGWNHEAGVVYDVNVYAVDFMHKDTFKGLAETRAGIDRHDFSNDKTTTRVSAKEGARSGSKGGGVSTKSTMLEERMLKADADLQRVWSLVKMRLYMTGQQWQQYLRDAEVPPATQAAVNLRYDSYMNELKAKMLAGEEGIEAANELHNTGFAVLDSIAKEKGKKSHTDPEEVKMAASNRIYEEKLLEMAAVRRTLQAQIKQYEAWLKDGNVEDAEALDAAIDGNLAILRDLISECAMFSNEAYVTDGAVNHTVVGLQSKVGISQTKSESMDAFNENVADSLKEIARHSSTLGEAAYKAGKYLWRMADAAMNLGSKDKDIKRLYEAGYIVANEIKGGDGTQSEVEDAAARALQTKLPKSAVGSPKTLMAYVRQISARVAKQHAADLSRNGQKRAEPVKMKRTLA